MYAQSTVVSMLLLCTLLATTHAQMLVPRTPADEAEELPPLVLQSQKVSISIDNQVATTRIVQEFVNNTETDLEAVYFIPLPEAASVSEFAYWVKGKRIVGQVKEKQEARETYERLVAGKRDPALLEKVGRNLFRANIFPVSPSEPMRVELGYEQVLPYHSGVVTYVYPLTMSGQQVEIGKLDIDIAIKDQKPITKVDSPSHPLTFDRADEHSAAAAFVAAGITPSHDLTISYTVHSTEFGVSFLAHRPEGEDGYFMLMVAPQEETSAEDIVKKDVVFVFDKSGSMQGDKIVQARKALEFCLRQLTDDDRFGIVTFSNEIIAYKDTLVPATQRNVMPALEHVKAIEADGMTDIEGALRRGLGMLAQSDRQRTIIFMTDGLPTAGVTDIATIIDNVTAANTSGTRIFTFGVGDDVDDYLLLKIATNNRGATEYVRTNESLYDKVAAFYGKISKPVLVNLGIDFGAIRTNRVYPDILPDVFKGSQLIIAGRYTGSGEQTVTLTGEVNGKPKTFEYPAAFPAIEPASPFVARVWAKSRVDYLLDQIVLRGENEELKQEIIALSMEYMFVTPYTSMLALPDDEAQAAMNQSRYATGGDPWIKVTAPPDAVRVSAVFPWGETKPLIYDGGEGRWKVRFIVPKDTIHGRYQVILVITLKDGSQRHLTITYEADQQAPSGFGNAFARRVGNDWVVKLAVAASEDAERVDVLSPGGGLVMLDYDGVERLFAGEVLIPADAVTGPSVFLPVYVTDAAHNRLEIEIEVELE